MRLNIKGDIREFKNKTIIMGILNVTPDSFSDGGKYNSIDLAFERAKQLIEEGADIIDIGGQSTRPGHKEVDVETEIERVIPVIKKIASELDTIISVDTYRHEVALRALEAGAHIVNDVWGLQRDNGEMAKVVAQFDVPVIVMHNQSGESYNEDILISIKKFLKKSFEIAEKNGVKPQNIIIDPGIGFGKSFEQNIEVIKRIDEITDLAPTLLGISKKRFIGAPLGLLPDERVEGTIAVNSFAAEKGVKIIRVHNVKEHKRAFSILDKFIY